MYVCIECGTVFEECERYTETHGLDTPPYEEWNGCPECGGAYTEAQICDCCGEYITGDYIKLISGERFCSDCFEHMELGDED